MSEIYVFIGKAGSGKNFYAEMLKKELSGKDWVGIDFKDTLIEKTTAFVGYDITKNYNAFKENVVGYTDLQISKEIKNKFPLVLTGRELLQKLGTEVFRNTMGKDFWVNELAKKVNIALAKGKSIYCCDCRFGNELAYFLELLKQGVKVRFVHCDYKSDRYMDKSDHASEIMAQELCDVVKEGHHSPYTSSFFNDSSANFLSEKFLEVWLNELNT